MLDPKDSNSIWMNQSNQEFELDPTPVNPVQPATFSKGILKTNTAGSKHLERDIEQEMEELRAVMDKTGFVPMKGKSLQKHIQIKSFKKEAKKENKTQSFIENESFKKKYSANSMFVLKRTHCFRRGVIRIVESRYFEYLILFIIVLNSLALALYDYSDRDSTQERNQILDQISDAFTAIFCLECVLKIIAMGFLFHKHAYLRDGWNIVDFVVVITGILELASGNGSIHLKSLRVLRVIRPLRTINAVPSMRKLVGALLQALPDFFHVAFFLIFIFVLFAILGVHEFNGSLYQRCRETPKPEPDALVWPVVEGLERACTEDGLGRYECPAGYLCGDPLEYGLSISLDSNYQGERLNYGITNFDDLGSAMLSLFVIITMDGWNMIMFNLMDADISAVAAIYCTVVIVVCSFFLMNLILAVIIQAFIKIQKNELEKQMENIDKLKLVNVQAKHESPPKIVEPQTPFESPTPGYSPSPGGKLQAMNSFSSNELEIMKQNTANFSSHSDFHTHVDPSHLLHHIFQKYNNKKRSGSVKDKLKGRKSIMPQKLGQGPTLVDNQSNANFVKAPTQKKKLIKPASSLLVVEDVTSEHLDKSSGIDKSSLSQISEVEQSLPSKQSKSSKKSHNSKKSLKSSKSSKKGKPKMAMRDEETPSALQELPAISFKPSLKKKSINESISLHDKSKEESMLSVSIDSPPKQQQQSSNLALSNLRKLQTKRVSTIGIGKYTYREDQIDKLEKQQSKKEEIPNPKAEGEQPKMSGMKAAFLKMIEKKKQEELDNNQIFGQVLSQTKQQMNRQRTSQATNLRQLAHQRLGMKLQRQKADLHKIVERIKIEDRAENNKCYHFAYKIAMSKWFSRLITFFIIVNTIILAMDKYPEDAYSSKELDQINYLLTLIFLLEMVIKLFAIGFKGYVSEAFNMFDATIVILSLIDMLLTIFAASIGNGVITAFRGFRLVRIFKLAKSWKSFQNLLKTMASTLKDVSTFSVLLFLFIFIYALLGQELFAFKAFFDSEKNVVSMQDGLPPDQNFDSFVMALTTTFIVLTNDQWSDTFINYYRTAGPAPAIVFFITLIFIGQKVLLNLFLAIILENFDENSLKEELKLQMKKEQEKDSSINKNSFQNKVKGCFQRFKDRILKKSSYQDNAESFKVESIEDSQDSSQQDQSSRGDQSASRDIPSAKGMINDNNQSQSQDFDNLEKVKPLKRRSSQFNLDSVCLIYGRSLGIFSQTNKFRTFCFKLVQSNYFNLFIIFFILVSGIQLAIDSPLNDPNGKTEHALFIIDILCTIVFGIEATLKIISFGLLRNGKYSYLRNSWNILDFIIIMFSVMALTPLPSSLKIMKMFRVIRVFRLLGKNEGLQLAVKALFSAIPEIISVTIITMLFFLILGILAVSFLKGQFFYCYTDNLDFEELTVITNKWTCYDSGGVWINQPFSFDNIFDAMRTIFQMATTKWAVVLFAALKSNGIDNQPTQESEKFWWILYFVLIMVLCMFFLLNLFIGAVISTFNREKEKLGGVSLLTNNQKEWIETKLITLKAKPIKRIGVPTNPIRKGCYYLERQPIFDKFIFICVIGNTVILTLKWYGSPEGLSQTVDLINYIFTGIFSFEAIIRIISQGKHYFKDNWNIFDFIVVLTSIVTIVLMSFSSFAIGGSLTIVRAFRVMRIFKFIKGAKKLRLVFQTFIHTIPALANVGGLLLLFLYLYSIIGVALFSPLKRNGIIDEVLNFENFGNSFITMFIVTTGDKWNDIMYAAAAPYSEIFQCISYPSYQDYVDNDYEPVGCGSPTIALIFFHSFLLIVNLIFLNLFIAIVLQGYEETLQKDEKLFNKETLNKFREVWSNFDPDATTFIKIYQLRQLLFDLGKPMGWGPEMKEKPQTQDEFIAALELPIYHEFQDYMFMDVLEALATHLYVEEQVKQEKDKQKMEKERRDSLLEISSDEESTINDQISKSIKEQIEKDIHKLEKNKHISQIREISVEKQRRATVVVQKLIDQKHFNSLHMAAAQVTVSHLKYLIAKKKLMKQINQIGEDIVAKEPQVLDLIQEEVEEEKNVTKQGKKSSKMLDAYQFKETESDQEGVPKISIAKLQTKKYSLDVQMRDEAFKTHQIENYMDTPPLRVDKSEKISQNTYRKQSKLLNDFINDELIKSISSNAKTSQNKGDKKKKRKKAKNREHYTLNSPQAIKNKNMSSIHMIEKQRQSSPSQQSPHKPAKQQIEERKEEDIEVDNIIDEFQDTEKKYLKPGNDQSKELLYEDQQPQSANIDIVNEELSFWHKNTILKGQTLHQSAEQISPRRQKQQERDMMATSFVLVKNEVNDSLSMADVQEGRHLMSNSKLEPTKKVSGMVRFTLSDSDEENDKQT